MPRVAKELSALAVQRLMWPGCHAVGGVNGLYLQVAPTGAKSWILRTMIGTKRRDMGLGGYPTVTLAQARERAREARESIEKGVDPIAKRAAERSTLAASQAAEYTFAECAHKFIKAKSAEWRNAKHAAQWGATLETYAFPIIGKLSVGDVTLPHILKVLEPIWTSKTETATRLRGRIENILDWATVRGYRQGENPARWRGHLDKVLAAPRKAAKVEHHRALPINEMGTFMADLRKREGIAALALEFVILTAARSGEVRGATWEEIDLDTAVWTIPGERMKASKEHRVPLSERAIQILKFLPRVEGSPYVFPAPRSGALSDMTLTAVMRRMGTDAVPHGFRSTFRDWAAERTNYPREVAETALAHVIENKVEAAYRRGDLFEKRARLMADWEQFVSTPAPTGQVIPMNRGAA